MRIDIEIPEDAAPGRYGVYALYDGAGDLLYIGMSGNLLSRLQNHRSQKSWWREVRRLEWTPCDGPNEARAFEKNLIEAFRPDNNSADRRALPRQSRQSVPDWMAAKLVELYEEERAAGVRHNSVERDRLNCYLAALREAGWRLEPLGLPLNMTRERVRQRTVMASSTKTRFQVVAPPSTRKPKPPKRVRPTISSQRVAEMLELQALARRVVGPTPLDSPLRVASERYTEMLAEEHLRGVSIRRISIQMGVTPMAISARLARHGYIEPVKGLPGNVTYGTPWNGPANWSDGVCQRGHDVTDPSNVRHINGDESRRTCIACERVRVEKYRSKRSGAGAA